MMWAAFLAASLALLPVFPSIATTCRAMISRFFAEFLQAENKEFSVQYPEYSGESCHGAEEEHFQRIHLTIPAPRFRETAEEVLNENQKSILRVFHTWTLDILVRQP